MKTKQIEKEKYYVIEKNVLKEITFDGKKQYINYTYTFLYNIDHLENENEYNLYLLMYGKLDFKNTFNTRKEMMEYINNF